MSLAFRTARTFWLKRNVKLSAVRPAPAPAGDSLLVSRFLHGDVNASRTKTGGGYFLPSISMAKTRATPTLRQQHIPPNVVRHAEPKQEFNAIGSIRPNQY